MGFGPKRGAIRLSKALQKHMVRWRNSAYLFTTEVLKFEPTDQQRVVLRSIKPGVHISIRSGHGVGKTALLAVLIIWFMCTRSDARIPCTASTGSQLGDVLWPEISKWLDKLPNEFRNSLVWQSERVYWKDRKNTWFAVARTARKENPDALQGFHAEHLMFVIDEAPGVPDQIFEVAEGALTKANVISIMTGNPTRLSGEFYRSHHQDRAMWKTFAFSAVDSPLVSSSYASRIAKKYGIDSDVYRVRVKGEFPLAESDTFISLPLVEAARLRDSRPTSPEYWGVDPARFGDDESALCKRCGNLVTYIGGLKKRDTMVVAGWVANQALAEKPDGIFVDVIGIGAGVFDRLKEQGFPVHEVNVSERADDSTEYSRKRDELWGRMRDALQNGLSIPNDEELTAQLSSPKYSFDSSGRIVIESKDHMKERKVSSPDRADSLGLTFATPVELLDPLDMSVCAV